MTLTWGVPANDGGSPVTGYNVYESTDGGSTWTLSSTVSSSTHSFAVTGLTNGSSYLFAVSASNAVGEGAKAESSPAVPATIPGAPFINLATAGNAQVVLSWSAPVSTGGSAITAYQISSDGGVTWATISNGAASSYTFAGLTNGVQYNFVVRAINGMGTGASSSPVASAPVAPPSPPTPPVIPHPEIYPVVSDFGIWTGSGTASAKVNAPFGKFLYLVHEGGSRVSGSNYQAVSGSTIITFSQAYLNTLANGTYYYQAVFSDGHSDPIKLVINRRASGSLPAAGDGTLIAPLMVSVLIAGTVVLSLIREREREDRALA
jgi:hypothetical protein